MAEPLLHTWEKQQPLYRIHPVGRAPNAFNASGRGNARFSPLAYPDGAIVPTLYGATSFDSALMETVFHDLPDDIDNHIMDFEDLARARVSCLAPSRDLTLLALTSVGLRPLKLRKAAVIETGVDAYASTRALALAWHRELPAIDGLYWTSRQDDRAQACMLFGDRVGASDLDTTCNAEPLLETPHVDALVRLARAIGIVQARSFPASVTGF